MEDVWPLIQKALSVLTWWFQVFNICGSLCWESLGSTGTSLKPPMARWCMLYPESRCEWLLLSLSHNYTLLLCESLGSTVGYWGVWEEVSGMSCRGLTHKGAKPPGKTQIAEDSFDLSTSGLWAQHASAAPLCSLSPQMGLEPTIPGLGGQCLIH